MKFNHRFKILVAFAILSSSNFAFSRHVQPKNVETIELDPDYTLSWELDDEQTLVTFTAVVQTTGYVGLGISPNGGMTGADIFIAGVDANGESYHSDRHGVGSVLPVVDDHADWNLLEASEAGGVTTLKFSRLLITCDDQDSHITADDTVRLIWAIGQTDNIEYHGETRRGTQSVNIIPPPLSEGDVSQFDKWAMTINSPMPSYHTSYWCTIHKKPSLGGMRHIVGFGAFLGDAFAKIHTHHFIVYRCYPPTGSSAEDIFEEHVGAEGEECYGGLHRIPKRYCQEYLYVWAIGGKTMIFPDDVGYPIEIDANESPYFMLEIHYDNPADLENVAFETGVEIYYTDVLREKEAGLMTIGLSVSPALTLPPMAENFMVAGHCPHECTNMFPEDGISVFNVLLHSHLAGRELRIRHFREGEELPWVLSDSSYDFNFQQNKALRTHTKVLQGDHLTYECKYNTVWNNGDIIYGGFSTREEMCQTFVWYYPRLQNGLDVCGGSYDLDQNFLDFGITNYTMEARDEFGGTETPIIWEPAEMYGMDYTTALSKVFQWTPQFREEFQEKRYNGELQAFCLNRIAGPIYAGTSKFPDYREAYVPVDNCDEPTPTTDAPNPTTDGPTTDAPNPTTDGPTTDAPNPTTDGPTTDAPNPTTDGPTTDAPNPITDGPTTDAPNPTTGGPTTDAPNPTTGGPTTDAPNPTTDGPTTDAPTPTTEDATTPAPTTPSSSTRVRSRYLAAIGYTTLLVLIISKSMQ